jgi:ferritin-like protein
MKIEHVFEQKIDKYTVRIYNDPERIGYFYYTIDDVRYQGASKKSIEKCLERAKKTVEIRKKVDAEMEIVRNKAAENFNYNSVQDFYRYRRKHNIKW